MKTDEALDRLLDRFEQLEQRLERLEARLAPAPGEGPPSLDEIPGDDAVVREDTFGPAIHRTSSAGHKNAVNKALSMLGLVPVTEDAEAKQRASTQHRNALNKALDVLGKPARDPKPETEPEPAAAPSEPEPDDAVPLPEIGAESQEPEAGDAPPLEPAPVPEETLDLAEALPVDLEEPEHAPRDHAIAILNGVTVAGAAGAALYFAGAIGADGIHEHATREIFAGAAAAACGAAAVIWRRLSIHLRALLAGASALLLHALVLMLVAPRMPASPSLPLGATLLASLLGATLVLQTRHPLALFLGFGVALALPAWLAPDPDLLLPYATVLNVTTAYCALRLGRLQASVAAAVLTIVLLVRGRGHEALAHYASICAATWFVQVLVSPFVHLRPNRPAAFLAALALGLVAWVVHGLHAGPAWIGAGALLLAATVSALLAGRLHRREALLRGVLKAGAVLLLIAAVPAGLGAAHLAPVAIFMALLFGVLARVLGDAFLRSVGTLMAVVAVVLLVRDGASAPRSFAAAVAALLLYGTRTRPEPAMLRPLLGAIAQGALLYGVWRFAPPGTVVYGWLAVALASGAIGRTTGSALMRAGAVVAAGAAAVGSLAGEDPARIGACAASAGALAWMLATPRLLLVAEVLALAAILIALPGPAGVLAALALPALLVLVKRRADARLVALVLIARALLPDVTLVDGTLRLAALAAFALAALAVVRWGGSARTPAAVLGCAVLAAAVWTATGAWPAALAAAIVWAGLSALAGRRRPGPKPGKVVIVPEPEEQPVA